MDDVSQVAAERVLERLQRIQELRGSDEPGAMLGELRELVGEAEEWSRLEGDERAHAAVSRLDDALAAHEEVRPGAMSLR
jgi:hypothetical protein